MTTTGKRIRKYKGLAVFERGFRPFFLSAGAFAGLAMPLWVLMLVNDLELPSSLTARQWHLHEMLFGYLSAVIAGFLLTAIPNWTGRLPVVGKPLAMLWALWLAGRFAMMFLYGFAVLAAIIDSAFLLVFAGLLWREILAGQNKKNIPVCLIISILALANVALHFHWLSDASSAVPERIALAMIAILISLIGGRIVPSFTRNWLTKQSITPLPPSALPSDLPSAFDQVDKAGLTSGVTAILVWVGLADHVLSGVLFAIASLMYFYRLSRWRGVFCWREPLVLILHVGYLWLPIWFALMAITILIPGVVDQASALHALSSGAIGTMTIAVVTRASLGHSNRPLTAGFMTSVIYVLIVFGAVLRVIADWSIFDFTIAVTVAGAMWSAGFFLFIIVYGRLLLARK